MIEGHRPQGSDIHVSGSSDLKASAVESLRQSTCAAKQVNNTWRVAGTCCFSLCVSVRPTKVAKLARAAIRGDARAYFTCMSRQIDPQRVFDSRRQWIRNVQLASFLFQTNADFAENAK